MKRSGRPVNKNLNLKQENEGTARAMSRLYHHLSPARKRGLVFLTGLMLVGAIAELATLGAVLPFLALLAQPEKAATFPGLQSVFSTLGWRDPSAILLPATLLFIGVVIIAAAIRLLLLRKMQRFSVKAGAELSTEVFRRTLYQPYIYHVSKSTSDLIASVQKVNQVIGVYVMGSMQVVTGIIISTFIIGGLIAINPYVSTTVGLSFVIIYSAVSFFSRKLLRANSKIWAAAQRTRVKIVQEGLGGLRDVIIDRTQPTFISHFAETDYNMRRVGALSQFIAAAPRSVIEALGIILIAGTALVLANGPGGLVASLPFLGAFAIGAQRLLPLIQNVFQYWTGFASNHQSLVDVLEVLDLPVDVKPASSQPIPFETRIEFTDVSFRYSPDQKDVLRSVSLTIPKGSRIGLIGKTGSGKTTLMDLIMGLLEPTGGEIRIDDRKLDGRSIPGWQAHLAHVPQAIYLADTTIAQNIAFGIPVAQIDMARLLEAAKEAELDAFVQTLPQKYDTIVGERGIRLSGGQRQRIGIARALYKRADVLVFDEATSALDNETEAAVMEAIESLPGNLTIIMIAHRLSTVAMCDTVIRLDDGSIVEQGDPEKMTGFVSVNRGTRKKVFG